MSSLFKGLRAWTVQRLSALYVLAFLAFVLIRFSIDPPSSYAAWHAWWHAPAVLSATLLFLAALCAHAWVGGRDVILDYVRPPGPRACALSLLALGLGMFGAWMALSLLAT